MGSYGSLWRARIEMMRPGNGLMVVFAVWLGAAHTVGWDAVQAERGLWLAAPLAAFMVNGFGNVINDIHDVIVDRFAHPKRPLPSGRIKMDEARAWAIILATVGLSTAYITGGKVLFAFALVNAVLLMLYEWKLKAWPIIGNLAIAVLVASAFAFGSVAAGGRPMDWSALWWIMAMVALVNVAREVLKDLEDQDADTNRKTLPKVIGPVASSWTASVLVGIAVGLDGALVWARDDWGRPARVLLALSGLAFIIASGAGCYEAGRGQRALKWAMLIALVGLALAP